MRMLQELAAERGGLIPTFRLRQVGFSARHIAALRHAGLLVRARQGWYLPAGTPAPIVQAVRVGGQLTCQRALAHHGVWVVADSKLHVAVGHNAARLRTPHDPSSRRASSGSNVVVHWRRPSASIPLPVADVASALTDLQHCASKEHFAVALDSALHQGFVDSNFDLARRYSAKGIVGLSESGIETLLWMRLPRLHRSLRQQVWISGVGRVDFLLGDRLVIEVDGRQFHNMADTFEADRRRDAALACLGYRVVRFSYAQVMHEWPTVERTIRELVLQGEHRARGRSPLIRDK